MEELKMLEARLETLTETETKKSPAEIALEQLNPRENKYLLQILDEINLTPGQYLGNVPTKHLQSEDGQITYLNLGSFDLKSIPSSIQYLHGLQQLDLDNNNLTELPNFFVNQPNIRLIAAYNNPIKNQDKNLESNGTVILYDSPSTAW